MNSIFSGPQLAYLIVAVVVLGFAVAGIVWIGRIVRGELGSDSARGGDPAALTTLAHVPPAMMKEAIARGLVVPSQLAGMTNAERTFLFASLKQKLAATGGTDLPAASAAVVDFPSDVPPAMRAILDAEKLRVWCPMCGTELQLPVFPPLLARCGGCGMKSAIRSEEGGRYTLNVSPPPKAG